MSSAKDFQLTNGLILRVVQENGVYKALNTKDKDFTEEIDLGLRKKAFDAGCPIIYMDGKFLLKDGNFTPPEVSIMDMDFIHSSYMYKPQDLFIKELKWKYLMRNVAKGKNIMMTGPSGAGKTKTAIAVAKVLKRPFFKFNAGAMQEPRTSLVGTVQFTPEKGTYFNEAEFVKAIKTPFAVILLDELSRAHPDAWNILMSVLDVTQRYIRLEEKEGQDVIHVANGVSFICTANIGTEYTSTRTFDRALMDRFTIVEMDLLEKDEEAALLKVVYGDQIKESDITALTTISNDIREAWGSEKQTLSTMVSTRMVVEVGEMLVDGFTLLEAMEVSFLPLFDASGGVKSERAIVNQIIDANVPKDVEDDEKRFTSGAKKMSSDNLFNNLINKNKKP